MKNILFFFSVVTIISVLNSCSDKQDLIGKWDDNIKLSTKAVEFDANSDSVIITTQGDWWWITDVTVDNETFSAFEGVNMESYNYSIKQDCFIVERRDKNTLFIKVDENLLSTPRIITVGLEAGDYFDRVTITQASK